MVGTNGGGLPWDLVDPQDVNLLCNHGTTLSTALGGVAHVTESNSDGSADPLSGGGCHVSGQLMADYYAQRASAGLIIAEATMVMAGNSAFWREPGIYSEAQVVGWRQTTDAVHAAGGQIFLQIWHGGRACHPLLNQGKQPVAPSAIAVLVTLLRKLLIGN